jgi:hypothetical protein
MLFFRLNLKKILIFLFLLMSQISLPTLYAQDLDDATISGVIKDQHGNPIEGGRVIAINTQTDLERVADSGRDGRFRIIELPPGLYNLRVICAGFADLEQRDISIISGQNLQLNFTIYPSGIAEKQVITGTVDQFKVDTQRTIVGSTITKEELETLPVASRSALDLVFSLSNISEEPFSTRDLAEDHNQFYQATPEEAGIFALSGGSAFSNNITIDGFDNNDDRSARERFQPSIEAVEEVQVITNQFSSEYGRASGGRVNLRTRSGSNQFKGRLFYFFRDEALDANSFKNNARNLKRPPFQQHNPGFTLSGPVKLLPYTGSQRTFFLFNYEYSTTLDSALINTLVPIDSNPLFPLPKPTSLTYRTRDADELYELAPFTQTINTPLRDHASIARVDQIFTENHNGTFSYQLGRYKNLRQFNGGSKLAESLQGRTRNSDALNFTDNYVLSSNAVNQFRIQFSQLMPGYRPVSDSPTVVITVPEIDGKGTDSLVAGSSSSGSIDRKERRFHLQDTVSIISGSHSLKLGSESQLVHSSFTDLEDLSGTYNFSSVGDFFANSPSRFRQSFHTESTQRNRYLGLFVNDQWQIGSRFTLSFGLRYENESIVKDRNNFAPRLAIAIDPFGSAKTVVRAGAGIFYNRALLRTIDDFSLGKGKLIFDTNNLTNPTTGKLLTTTERRSFITSNLHFPQTLSVNSPLIEQYAIKEKTFLRQLNSNLRIPESYQFNIGFERELYGSTIVEVNYTYNRGIHLWRERNINAPQIPSGFSDFTSYLLSTDFPNFRNADGVRPIYNTTTAGDWIRFTTVPVNPNNPDAIVRRTEGKSPITFINLNSLRSTTSVETALAALRNLRPNPQYEQIEEISSIGNSFYHGLTIETRQRFISNWKGLGLSYRASYTLSKLIDDGSVNTSSALIPGDFRRERARSLLDRRHRFSITGMLGMPSALGGIQLSTILRVISGAPFNISIGGMDRNLDDVGTDRPSFSGDLSSLKWRRSSSQLDSSILDNLKLPTIGQSGDLPRNAGSGPSQFLMDISLTREFRIGEKVSLRPVVEVDNVLNKTIYSFGSEYINFAALDNSASVKQKESFMNSFLVPSRTLRPRTFRLGIRFDF